tara:strand:- start:145 stop:300 length:156 start_codon:yes stop_codon:yes gene_type:complete
VAVKQKKEPLCMVLMAVNNFCEIKWPINYLGTAKLLLEKNWRVAEKFHAIN